ncbi:MAG: YCF48-related protein [Porticoccaceae bacterium]|nr:YCF48-related protein [Porticoccaceae bacterium]
MAVFKHPFKHSRLAVLLLTASLMPLQLLAQNTAGVPDVLDMPAMETRQAQNSLQLGISRAGERLVSVGVRGIVLLSDDEGRSWRQARHVPVSVTLADVEFVSPEHGWAIGHSGVLLFSSDGGETWERRMDGSQAAEIVLQAAREQLAMGVEGAQRAVRNAEFLVEDGPDKPFLNIAFADQQSGYDALIVASMRGVRRLETSAFVAGGGQ